MSTTGRLLLPYPTSTDTADVPRDLKALADRVEALTAWIRQADFASGAGVHWPGDLKFSAALPPAGVDWLFCDGTSYLRATYQALFDALGGAASPWGLPDGTHFKVPDLRGRSPIGTGTGTALGATIKNIGQLSGEETHTLTTAEMPSHTHDFSDVQPYNSGLRPTANGGQTNYDGTQTNVSTTVAKGGGAAHNVLSPVTAVYVLIKT
jgi:microcystin-dependent protein